MRIPIIKVSQPIGTFYLSALPATIVLQITEVKRRKSGKGVQRELSSKRVKEISEYCNDQDATFPTPIIIAVTSDKFVIDKETILEFDESQVIGEIIDGQHRVEGLRKSNNAELFSLPIILMFDLTEEEKAYVFSIINSKQTKVSMSLIYDLFALSEKRSPQKTCHEIARLLNSDPHSPFYRRLKMLGEKQDVLSTLSQGSFIKYLMPLISKKPDEDMRILKNNGILQDNTELPLRKFFITKKDDVIYKIIFNLFSGLSKVFQEEWNNPNKYMLSKTVGYGAVLTAFPSLYKIGIDKKDLSINFFESCFLNFKNKLEEDKLELTSEYFPSNQQQLKRLAKIIINSL